MVTDDRSRSVSVDDRTRLAARSVRIRIPTLCKKVEGVPGCGVVLPVRREVDGRATLTPSCALPVAPGMMVHGPRRSARVRKTALELLLSDHVGDCVGPATACRRGSTSGVPLAGGG
jgi:predicted molibdopterin-dependent oxidoreductase YjgC